MRRRQEAPSRAAPAPIIARKCDGCGRKTRVTVGCKPCRVELCLACEARHRGHGARRGALGRAAGVVFALALLALAWLCAGCACPPAPVREALEGNALTARELRDALVPILTGERFVLAAM